MFLFCQLYDTKLSLMQMKYIRAILALKHQAIVNQLMIYVRPF